MAKIALVGQGGGMRNAFASGVFEGAQLDPTVFDACFATSSFSTTAALFLSGLNGLTKDIWINQLTKKNIFSLMYNPLVRRRRPADVHELIANVQQYLDKKALNPDLKLIVTVARLKDGTTHYIEVTPTNALSVFRAACALPIIAKPQKIDDPAYGEDIFIDGGVSDTFPVQEVYNRGYRRILIVSNRPFGAELRPAGPFMQRLAAPFYPETRQAIERRHIQYKKAWDFIRNPPKDVSLIVLSPPEELPCSRLDRSPKRVAQTYDIGVSVGAKQAKEIKDILEHWKAE